MKSFTIIKAGFDEILSVLVRLSFYKMPTSLVLKAK